MTFENEVSLSFSHVPLEKLQEKSLQLTIHGKDQHKKTVHLGQIGKIHFNQLKQFQAERPLDLLHEVKKIKPVRVLREREKTHTRTPTISSLVID